MIFPQIVNVVCDNCSSVLKKSHERSRMFKQNNKYFVEYICRIQNSHQDKKVFFQHEICSGVRALCTKKS